MNARECVKLAREHWACRNKDLALGWLVSAVEALVNTEQVETPVAPLASQIKMTAEDAAVYAEAMKTLALLRAKYGAVAL